MTIFDGELIILWKLSDLVLLLLTAAMIQNLLFLLFFAVRKNMERKMSKCGIRRLMKLVLWYALVILPIIAMHLLFH